MRPKVQIAFRRKVRAVWLERGLDLAAGGRSWPEAKAVLAMEIAAENPGAETIRKVLEHIRRIWFDSPPECRGLRDDALRIYRASHGPEVVLLLIWGMAICSYPFVGSVAETLGRLLRLQPDALRADVQRRMREQHGDRDFVSRITRYNISSFLDWGVIVETKDGGAYRAARTAKPRSHEHTAWLLEAVLISRNVAQMPLSQITHHPLLFPIVCEEFNTTFLRSNPRLRSTRQGLSEEWIALEKAP